MYLCATTCTCMRLHVPVCDYMYLYVTTCTCMRLHVPVYQERPIHNGWWATAVPEIWRKTKLNIRIQVFVRTNVTYLHSLKECGWDNLKFKYSLRTPKRCGKWAGCALPRRCVWVSATRSRSGLQILRPRGFQRGFLIFVFTFCDVSSAGIFITFFL
jgi:hypothetical protein